MTRSRAAPERRIAVLTDSAANLPESLLARHGINVVPMTFAVGDSEIIDAPGADYGDVYDAVNRDPSVPFAASAPLPDVWRDAIIAAADSRRAESVLIITTAARLSASYDAAQIGAQLAAQRMPKLTVQVVDSDAVAGAQGLICMAASDVANQGARLDEVTEAAKDGARNAHTVAMLGSLNQVHRVTRLPSWVLTAARTLPMHPVVRFDASDWSVLARPLTRRLGLRKLAKVARQSMADEGAKRAIVMHVQRETDAQRVADELARHHPATEITVCEMHPFAGVPAGAGTVGVAWVEAAVGA